MNPRHPCDSIRFKIWNSQTKKFQGIEANCNKEGGENMHRIAISKWIRLQSSDMIPKERMPRMLRIGCPWWKSWYFRCHLRSWTIRSLISITNIVHITKWSSILSRSHEWRQNNDRTRDSNRSKFTSVDQDRDITQNSNQMKEESLQTKTEFPDKNERFVLETNTRLDEIYNVESEGFRQDPRLLKVVPLRLIPCDNIG